MAVSGTSIYGWIQDRVLELLLYDDYVCYHVAFWAILFISSGSLHGAAWFTGYIVVQRIAP